jgi:hypothetical protein
LSPSEKKSLDFITKFGTKVDPPQKLLKYLTHKKKGCEYTATERVRIHVKRHEYM